LRESFENGNLTDQSKTRSLRFMARPRKYDADVALESAMQVFWHQGFDGSSLTDLTEATGMGRQSLYAAFGDKRDLYLAAIERYRVLIQEPMLEALRSGDDLLGSLRQSLLALADGSCGPVESGCFLVNAATERAADDPAVRESVRAAFVALEDVLTQGLELAARGGRLRAGTDPRAAAALITATIQGLRVVAAVSADREQVSRIVDALLASLT
jgi:TetR/AcrR family transcriptional regulator, transcriptional repressor for nem operon